MMAARIRLGDTPLFNLTGVGRSLATASLTFSQFTGKEWCSVPATPDSDTMNIVLVHGAWADGSGWEGVYRSLRKEGFPVSVVQNPTISLADDVKAVQRVL